KCINCGRCVRTCAEIQGPAVLGYIYRGFAAVVTPEFGESLTQTSCESCGKCIAVCPVGALVERNRIYKLNPLAKQPTTQSCGICGTGCQIVCESQSGVPVRIGTDDKEPGFNGRNLCFKGRFGWQALFASDRLRVPQIKEQSQWRPLEWPEARSLLAAKLKASRSKRFEATPQISLEEMLSLQKAAQICGAEFAADPRYRLASAAFLPLQPSEAPYDILDRFDTYVVIGEISHTLRTLLRLRQRTGKRVLQVLCDGCQPMQFAAAVHSSLEALDTSKRQLYIYNLNRISEQNIARILAAANIRDPWLGDVLESTDYQNYYGLQLLKPAFTESKPADLVLAWGGRASKAASKAFTIEINQYLDPDSEADLLLPQASYLETEGVALATACGITRFANPARSKLLPELLRLFCDLELLPPATADLRHWNTLAEELISRGFAKINEPYDPAALEIAALRATPLPLETPLEQRIVALYESRKSPSSF
ncbi:MAG TPA: 4Fe-4S dicluster domain-containing protein, partial [Candidatus Syntrophosphaera sp.]|nr:4Fe-4S dicluster domain-containing protein [Candidatus Syntrophosphaera sp.]